MSTLTKNQKKTYRKDVIVDGEPVTIIATVRHDDEWGNGHNTFAITAEVYDQHGSARDGTVTHKTGKRLKMSACGCCHDEIAKHFPELREALKFHLCSTDGPLHYVANTMYNARDNGPTHALVRFDDPENGIKAQVVRYCPIEEAKEMCLKPGKVFNYVSRAGYRFEADEKTAKKADLEAARNSAIWPDATLEQLQSKEALEARLPELMREFKATIEALGFEY